LTSRALLAEIPEVEISEVAIPEAENPEVEIPETEQSLSVYPGA